MFALVALICFVLALFKVHVGTIDLAILGFCFISLHLLFGAVVTIPWTRRND